MASKNSVKIYVKDGFYHVYNRGVEKRSIFQDNQDFSVFLSYIQTYLTPKDIPTLQSIIASQHISREEKDQALKLLKLRNYSEMIELHCYALLPNHFHLLIKQKSNNTLNFFMNSLGTRYGMYFNRKYKRTGVLFQDVYKAVIIETDEQLLHVSRYIHKNPINWLSLPINGRKKIQLPSSLSEYLGKRETTWIKTDHILSYFSKNNQNLTYENFLGLKDNLKNIQSLVIENDLD